MSGFTQRGHGCKLAPHTNMSWNPKLTPAGFKPRLRTIEVMMMTHDFCATFTVTVILPIISNNTQQSLNLTLNLVFLESAKEFLGVKSPNSHNLQ